MKLLHTITLTITILLISLIKVNSQTMANQENDLNAITDVINDYFEGTTNGNIVALKRAFHEDCKIYSINESGELVFLDQMSFYEVVLDNYKTFKRKNMLLNIDISGNTASVKTRADYPPFAFIDYLSILKIKGKWKIISKTSYTLTKSDKK